MLVTVTSSLLVPADRLAELYFVNRLFVGKVELDPARLYRE